MEEQARHQPIRWPAEWFFPSSLNRVSQVRRASGCDVLIARMRGERTDSHLSCARIRGVCCRLDRRLGDRGCLAAAGAIEVSGISDIARNPSEVADPGGHGIDPKSQRRRTTKSLLSCASGSPRRVGRDDR